MLWLDKWCVLWTILLNAIFWWVFCHVQYIHSSMPTSLSLLIPLATISYSDISTSLSMSIAFSNLLGAIIVVSVQHLLRFPLRCEIMCLRRTIPS